MFFAAAAAALIAICPPSGPRHQCVVDGDTVWLAGEKIRIADIDAPEMRGKCRAESARAIVARDRLTVMMNAGPVTIRRTGKDRYGRTLARLSTREGSVGRRLIAEGLASKWPKRRNWCRG